MHKDTVKTLWLSAFSPKIKLNTVKHVLNGHSKRRPKLACKDRLLLFADCNDHVTFTESRGDDFIIVIGNVEQYILIE